MNLPFITKCLLSIVFNRMKTVVKKQHLAPRQTPSLVKISKHAGKTVFDP